MCALAFDAKGSLLASAQEGKHAVIRVWDFALGTCLAVLMTHASGLTSVDVSADGKALLGVGLDQHGEGRLEVLLDRGSAGPFQKTAEASNIFGSIGRVCQSPDRLLGPNTNVLDFLIAVNVHNSFSMPVSCSCIAHAQVYRLPLSRIW